MNRFTLIFIDLNTIEKLSSKIEVNCTLVEIIKTLLKSIEKLKYIFQFQLQFGNYSISSLAFSEKECDMWLKGLRYMVDDTINSPYPIQVEHWLRKEFYMMMGGSRDTVSLKDVKEFLPRIHCKMSTSRLRELFQVYFPKLFLV